MITGVVSGGREATIPLEVRGSSGQVQTVAAVIDTGFDGWLTLPPALVIQLGLPWRRRGRVLLADGTDSIVDVYEAIVSWDGQPRRVAADEADTVPLVGMSPLDGYELNVQVRPSGTVLIRALP